MKAHHTLGYIIFIALIVIGIFVWVRPKDQIKPNQDSRTDSTFEYLQGSWFTEGMYEDGSNWYMRYEFIDSNFTLETDSYYAEEGIFRVSNTYEDGTIEIEKTYKDGEKVYTMIIAIVDENTFTLEGATLHRIAE